MLFLEGDEPYKVAIFRYLYIGMLRKHIFTWGMLPHYPSGIYAHVYYSSLSCTSLDLTEIGSSSNTKIQVTKIV